MSPGTKAGRPSRETTLQDTSRRGQMRTQQAAPSPGKANLALATLFSGIFVLGSAELLVVGVLNLVGADLRVSIPAAGALVTAYAPGLGIGEPIDRADGWNLVAGVSLHRPRSVPPYVPDITARFHSRESQQLGLRFVPFGRRQRQVVRIGERL